VISICIAAKARSRRVFLTGALAALALFAPPTSGADETNVFLPGDIDRVVPMLMQYADYRLFVLADERKEAKLLLGKLRTLAAAQEQTLLAFAPRARDAHMEPTFFLLGLAGTEKCRKVLEERFAKGDTSVRIAAARGLALMDKGFAGRLQKLAVSDKPDDRFVAAHAMSAAGESSMSALASLAQGEEQRTRIAACLGLAELGTEESAMKLFELLDKAKDPIDIIAIHRAISLATHIETDQADMKSMVLAQAQLESVRNQSDVVKTLLGPEAPELRQADMGQRILLKTLDELILRLEVKIGDPEMFGVAPQNLTPEQLEAMAAKAAQQAMQAALTPSQGSPRETISREHPANFRPVDLKLRPVSRSIDWGKLPGVDTQTVANALGSTKVPEHYKRILKAYYRALAETELERAP